MLNKVLAALYAQTPPILVGAPGLGKTAFARALARHIGGRSFFVCLSHKEGTEVHGTPVVAKETIEHEGKQLTVIEQAPPDYAVTAAKSNVPVIIVYDELTCIPPTTAGPTLAILGEYRIADMYLDPNKVGIIACANPPEMAAGGWQLAPPMVNRLKWLLYKLEPRDWAEKFPTYWNDPPLISRWEKELPESLWAQKRSLVAAFIRQKGELLLKLPKDMAQRGGCWVEKTKDGEEIVKVGGWPSPRTWDFVSRDLAIAERDNLSSDDLHDLIVGDVGEPAALELANWIESVNLHDPRDLVNDPNKFIMPAPDQLYYLIMGCCSEVAYRKRQADKTDRKAVKENAIEGWLNVWKILGQIVRKNGPKDIAAIAANILAQKENHPKGAKPPAEVDLFIPVIRAAGVSWGPSAGDLVPKKK